MTRRPAWILIAAATIGCLTAGCGPRRPPRYRVSGRVVFAGRAGRVQGATLKEIWHLPV